MKRLKGQQGYTLVELILALALFNFVLLIVTVGYLTIVHIHENGVATRNAEQNNRFGVEELVRASRAANGYVIGVDPATHQNTLCLYGSGNPMEFYVSTDGHLHQAILNPNWADKTVCPPKDSSGALVAKPYDKAISSDDVIILNFNLTQVNVNDSFMLDMTIGTRGNQFDSHNNNNCDPTQPGAQFCASTRIHTAVTLRGGQP